MIRLKPGTPNLHPANVHRFNTEKLPAFLLSHGGRAKPFLSLRVGDNPVSEYYVSLAYLVVELASLFH